MMRLSHVIWSVSLFVSLAGCGPESQPEVAADHPPTPAALAGDPGVIHLDPRLADGRSPAEAIAQAQVVRTTDLDQDWSAEGAELRPADDGSGHVLGVPSGPGAATTAVSLRWEQPLRADRWDALEVSCRVQARTSLRLSWTEGGRTHAVSAEVELTPDPTTARFELSSHPSWRGAVESVTISLAVSPQRPLELYDLRFLAGGLNAGFAPLGEDSNGARSAGDMGLVALGIDARRAWPSEQRLPLFAKIDAPAGAVLSLSVAPGRSLVGSGARVTFQIDGRRGDGPWKTLGERELTVPGRAAELSWQPWRLPLDDLAGAPAELRFVGRVAGARSRDALPPAARLLWSTPEVLLPRPSEGLPHLLLVTLDTTRGDAVGGRGWTPTLDALADRGLLFESAWAAAESTTASHASLMTGLQVQEHGALGNRYVLPADVSTVAERLRARGYHTAAAVSAFHLQAGNGFGQGFDQFLRARAAARTDGRLTLEAVDEMLAEWRDLPDRPTFLWLHLFDPHTPYQVPDDFRARYLAEHGLTEPPARVDEPTVPVFDRYPGGLTWLEGFDNLERVVHEYHLGVAHADQLVGELMDAWAETADMDRTAVIVTSDHGEALGEREQWFNHVGLFREVLHVPMILALPPGDDRSGLPGRRIASPVSGIDVAPTLLELAGLPPEPDHRGRSLLTTATSPDPDRRIWFQHSGLLQAGFRGAGLHFVDTLADGVNWVSGSRPDKQGVRVPHWTHIPDGRRYLFDGDVDPDESDDLSEGDRRTPAMARYLQDWMEILGRRSAESAELTAEDEAVLRSLGYAGADGD